LSRSGEKAQRVRRLLSDAVSGDSRAKKQLRRLWVLSESLDMADPVQVKRRGCPTDAETHDDAPVEK